VHRDLKPQNIMIEDEGRVWVMDFGIAQSHQTRGATVTGSLMGTPDYMSPEQARGEDVDERSDIFSLGLIFYELVTGRLAFQADTMLETLFKRTKERVIPPVEIDQSVPKGANEIIVKCLETDREKRHQKVVDIRRELEALDPSKRVGAATQLKFRLKKLSRYKNWAIGAAGALLLIAGSFALRDRFRPAVTPPQAAVTVLVADFENATGDPVFSGTLESMCTTAMEEASFVNIYKRNDARSLLARLENNATKLDEAAARRIAIREGISVILAGSIARPGSSYQLSLRAVDAVTGKIIGSKEVTSANQESVLASVGKLVAPIRTALGDTTPESAQLAATETYTAGSLEAAHAYALGQENQSKPAEAIRYYQRAVELDPALGRAYAGLASANFNLKKHSEADAFYKQALKFIDRMSEREKYRTLATYHLTFSGNYDEAIETLRKLVFLFPADGTAYTNLSTAYKRVGSMAEAESASRRAVELSPNSLLRRYNYAANALAAGDFNTAIAEANKIIEKDASFVYAYMPLAMSAVFRSDQAKALETWAQLEKVNSLGASLSKMGQSDLQMYAGGYPKALATLNAGIAADEKEGNTGELAQKLIALAETQMVLGHKKDAVSTAAKAVQTSELDDGIRFLAARTMVEAGEDAKAELLAKELEGRLQKQTRSLALMIGGDIALKRGRLADAVDAYRGAQKLHDSWFSHFLLGKAYVEARHYPEALPELETAERRASEAIDLFDSNTTTLRYLPPLVYWLGRAQEGLGTAEAARKSYERYISIRSQADSNDKLLGDARGRAGR
jgi:tetratricopeptide (TPR) repeat protein